MAFNIIAETNKKLDFNNMHKEIYQDNLPFDLVPMPNLGISGGDAIGICVPLTNANEKTWRLLKPVLKKLKSRFGCAVYDLYGGQKLGLFNINEFKENLLLK
jgi:hypothetical protein